MISPAQWRSMLMRWAVFFAVLTALLALHQPQMLFGFPRRSPRFWLFVMAAYPVLSVAAQGVLYRWFHEAVFAPLFGSPRRSLLAGALGVPVAVMETAGEGGPWGMALLAAYRAYRAPGQTLEEYLAQGVFAGAAGSVEAPTKTDCGGFNAFFARYRACLPAQSAAAKALAAGEG